MAMPASMGLRADKAFQEHKKRTATTTKNQAYDDDDVIG